MPDPIITDEPVESIVEPDNPLPSVTLDDLPPTWRQGIDRAGWKALMPVQSKAMPYIMAGRDLMVQSRTGSGKTGAFLLPILERINPLVDETQALILTPTRELARQIRKEAEVLVGERPVRMVSVYGGVSYKPQLEAFRKGAHIVIGTPGRILDHLLRGSLKLDSLKILVFDEADRMLSMGFYPDMKDLQRYLPDDYDGFMFSATIPKRVMRLAREFLDDPGFLSLSRDNVHVTDMDHVFYRVNSAMDKDRALVRIIEMENPASALIFCNTKMRVDYVKVVLQRFGYDADALSSDLSQHERETVLGRMLGGDLRFLVATDVAARGIDIPDLSHVVQYEPPEDPEMYIHRAGRTGRAGASGEAVTLVDFMEGVKLKRIARQYDIELEERSLPDDEDVANIVAERLIVLLEARLRGRDKLKIERMERFFPLIRELSQDEDGVALMAMLVDDYYQSQLHNPPPEPDGRSARTRRDNGRRHDRRDKGGRRRRR